MLSALKIPKELTNKKLAKIFSRDSGSEVERRVKILTAGNDDTADPCVPVEVTLPDGKKMHALYCSGGRVLYYSSLKDLLHGGIKEFEKIEVMTKDGNPLLMEPFHQAEAIWDTELVCYFKREGDSKVLHHIGHGGMMERVEPLVPCTVSNHNYRRSRHAFDVKFSIDEESKSVREVWTDLGPIHGNRPTSDGRWVSQQEDQLHAHGYGSRMIRDLNGEPWRDVNGFMWMTYEEVTEERILGPGRRLPFGTKIFARQVNEELTLGIGKPILLSGYEPWDCRDRSFVAARRWDPEGMPAGFLVEGPNPICMTIENKRYWVIFFSAGDFVSKYGNFMMYRTFEEGPIGPYQHVVDSSGELIDLTHDLVGDLDLTWAGRLNPFYDDQKNLWGVMHGIFKSDIPDGWTKSGWPRTAEEFISYARRVILVPLSAGCESNIPLVTVDSK